MKKIALILLTLSAIAIAASCVFAVISYNNRNIAEITELKKANAKPQAMNRSTELPDLLFEARTETSRGEYFILHANKNCPKLLDSDGVGIMSKSDYKKERERLTLWICPYCLSIDQISELHSQN